MEKKLLFYYYSFFVEITPSGDGILSEDGSFILSEDGNVIQAE